MKAMVIQEYGGPEQLVLRDIPTPTPQADEVLIKVRALGINRAETYMRRGQWAGGVIAPVSGIECVGVVAEDPSGRLQTGETVAAVMGGMGRTRNGSYAEYVCVPASNVIPLKSALDWPDLAAIPESYVTAWTCLYDNLKITSGQVLMVRGGTSALGQAAVNIAAGDGLTVIATTRSEGKFEHLRSLGAVQTLVETGTMGPAVRDLYPGGIDCVLDLVGNSTMLDSLSLVHRGGRVCMAGFLGGGTQVSFDPLSQMPSGVDLSFFGSFMFGADEFPLSRVPLQQIVDRAARGEYHAKPAKVFSFAEIPEAHRLMEANAAGGKIVVVR